MKEFRIAKCLEDGKINEYVIFADGSRKKMIHTNEKYGKYFEVDNELNTDCKSFLRFSYSGRIKDAIEMIRNGNGDCISSEISPIAFTRGRTDKVLYFLDRQIGEELRQKSLEGWKDTKFGWVIECGYKNSFSGYSILNKINERILFNNKNENPMLFDTKEAAIEYVDRLIEKAKYYANQLVTIASGVKDEKEINKIVDNTMNEIGKYTGTKASIISEFAFDMITDNCQPKTPEYSLDKMGYEVIQCII